MNTAVIISSICCLLELSRNNCCAVRNGEAPYPSIWQHQPASTPTSVSPISRVARIGGYLMFFAMRPMIIATPGFRGHLTVY